MPISSWGNIPAVMNEIYRLQPKTVIDLGVGFGKWGTLAREVLDAMHGRCRPDQWKVPIVGVEAWEAYQNPAWEVYDAVGIYDFAKDPPRGFDLVLMIDSLEHLEPEAGRAFLAELLEHNKHVIVSVPIEYMPQGAAYGNKFETHRTHHSGAEFDQYQPTVLHRDSVLTVSMKGKWNV